MSNKLPTPKSGIMDISPYVAGKSKAAGEAKKIIKLSSNESALGPSPKALKAYADHAAKLHRYPDSAAHELRDAIGRVHSLKAEQIVCGAGSDELIGLLVHAYAGPGDEVLYSQHGFLMYKIYAQGNGATPVTAPEKNLTADVDALLAAVTPRTKLLFLANPNNPTGTYLPGSELARLREGLREDIILVIDAAYAEFAEANDYSAGKELVDTTGNTVMLRTFSKIYGLSSLRLGWGYFPPAIADVMNRLRGPFNVSAVALAVGAATVEDTEFTAKAKAYNSKWLAWTAAEITKLGVKIYPSLANFLLVEFSKQAQSASAANTFLLQRGIIAREMAGYGLPECLRITIGSEDENRALVAALNDFFKA